MNDISIELRADELPRISANGVAFKLTPTIPAPPATAGVRHYTHARFASLFYYGTPLDDTTKQLLKNSIDLVICGEPSLLASLDAVAPADLPILLYTNCSNIYSDMLHSWLTWYGANKLNAEVAFLHDSGGNRIYYNADPTRPLTNPMSPEFAAWTLDYHKRFLAKYPRANGLFIDNSTGAPPATSIKPVEDVTNYAKAYASILGNISQATGCLVVPNTGGASVAAIDLMIAQCNHWYEEFMLRPLSHNWKQFEETAAIVAGRQAAHNAYGILDSHPAGGSPTDQRTQMATLAYYYLLADPTRTCLDFYGGFEPGTTWSRHWCLAAAVDIGQPTETWKLSQSGVDPADSGATYRIYSRAYTKATVFYRPLSFKDWQTKADLSMTSAIPIPANGPVLDADGDTTTFPTSYYLLRNGEGAIIMV